MFPLLSGNPYSSFLRIWRQYISSLHIRISTTAPCPSPPTPLPPEAAVCLAFPVDAATRCLSPSPFPSPSLFRSSLFQLIVVFPPTAIAVAAVVFVASPLPWLSPSPLLLPSHSPSPQLQSSPPPSTPLPSSPLSPTTAATAAVGSKRWFSALALSAGSQRRLSAHGLSAWLQRVSPSAGSHRVALMMTGQQRRRRQTTMTTLTKKTTTTTTRSTTTTTTTMTT
jgi:hypothetical protein